MGGTVDSQQPPAHGPSLYSKPQLQMNVLEQSKCFEMTPECLFPFVLMGRGFSCN